MPASFERHIETYEYLREYREYSERARSEGLKWARSAFTLAILSALIVYEYAALTEALGISSFFLSDSRIERSDASLR